MDAKICGITDKDALRSAVSHGARYIGFVFAPASPRRVEADYARDLAALVPAAVRKVGLFVDAAEDDIVQTARAVRLDMVQLHGTETPRMAAQVKARTGLPVIKAIGITQAADLRHVRDYEGTADFILLDARAGDKATFGGEGTAFDWAMLHGFACAAPWILAGGLHAGNVAQALSMCNLACRPVAVDVSSGVERERGVKDPDKIAAFLKTCKAI